VREHVKLPIITKISPMLTAPLNVVRELERIGVHGVTVFNRMTGLDVDIESQKPTMPGSYAGHGGPWAIQYPLRWISAMYPQVSIDIAGSGGVASWEDVVKYLLVGATVVQTCTAVVMNGYGILQKLVRGLEQYMDDHGYERVGAFRGKVCDRILTTEQIPRTHVAVARIDPGWAAPCKDACPIHVPAQAYVRLIAQRRFAEAYRIIRSKDPFQSICGYVCYHPCEDVCTRGKLDAPIAIRALKRFALAWGKDHLPQGEALDVALATGRKVAVVGSGPAGLTAAYDLAKAGHQVTVFEARSELGGMLRTGIPQYRLPRETLAAEVVQIAGLGVTFQTDTAVGDDIALRELQDGFDAILLAIGAYQSAKLAIPGEEGEGLVPGIRFVEAVNARGQFAIAGHSVAVVGGGNTALDAARSAIRLGAKEVYLLYRRTRQEMLASSEEIEQAEEEGVRILYLVAPVRVLRKNGKVSALRCINLFLGEADRDARRRPKAVEGTEFTLKADTVIPAVSQLPDLRGLAGGLKVDSGRLSVLNDGFATGVAGVFAAGDATTARGSVVEAIASGRSAAVAIDHFLQGDAAVLQTLPQTVSVDTHAVLRRSIDEAPKARQAPPLLSVKERRAGFQNVEGLLSEEQAVAEAQRCLGCGCGVGCDVCYDVCIYDAVEQVGDRYVIDQEGCDGCGLCPERCPNEVISMVPRSPRAEGSANGG
jgi:NADPH-dependent glutamate synthase beta subunit-like oxidoreductase/NAD-dependent dihydropyrimidine dehydrogenase PreA subunit